MARWLTPPTPSMPLGKRIPCQFFGIWICEQHNSFVRKATAHGAFQFGARNPVIAQCLDVSAFGDLFALFSREHVVVTFSASRCIEAMSGARRAGAATGELCGNTRRRCARR